MKESVLQKGIISYLESQGAYVVKVISASKTGVPDILACYSGLFIGIECKAPGKLTEVTPIQKYNLDMIKRSGGISLASDSITTIKDLVCRLKQDLTK